MDDRLNKELELLRQQWPDLIYREDSRWILLQPYRTPDTCVQDEVDIAFQVKPGHPGDAPYGFFVRKPITLDGGGAFNNTTDSNEPPFEGNWLKFSWSPVDWRPGANVRSGSNLANWAMTFYNRLEEGR